MSHAPAIRTPADTCLRPLDRAARRLVLNKLAHLRRGTITLCDSSGSSQVGELADLRATIRVQRPRFFRQAILGGTLSVAESYLRGDWDCDDLTSLFRILCRNQRAARGVNGGFSRVASWAHRMLHWWHANSRAGARRNIAAHYDLGNAFYALWLDETLAYSSAIFPHGEATLREASTEKFDRVCRMLALQPTDRVVEIGTGWGGFALHACKNYRCRVTTTTISDEQAKAAGQRFRDAGLSGQIELLQQDYRDLDGQFDKLASIEMIEAVGHRNLDQYFRRCSELLRPEGSMVLQAIVMPDQQYRRYLKSVDFIQRYVFPGGCLPSLGSILNSVARATNFRFVQAYDFGPHYAETLRRWRRQFQTRLDDVRRLGYSQEFVRLWNYYLCYCEAAFDERCVGVLQIQLDKPDRARSLIDSSGQA